MNIDEWLFLFFVFQQLLTAVCASTIAAAPWYIGIQKGLNIKKRTNCCRKYRMNKKHNDNEKAQVYITSWLWNLEIAKYFIVKSYV